MNNSKFAFSQFIQFFLFIVVSCCSAAHAFDPTCSPSRLENETQLDLAFDQSRFVFVASVVVRDGDVSVFEYALHPPALKGDIPLQGTLRRVTRCSYIPLLDGQAIILLFLNSLDELVSHENAVLVALSTDEPSFNWVVDWLKNKSDR